MGSSSHLYLELFYHRQMQLVDPAIYATVEAIEKVSLFVHFFYQLCLNLAAESNPDTCEFLAGFENN